HQRRPGVLLRRTGLEAQPAGQTCRASTLRLSDRNCPLRQ
ncbi:MAG: hypothetical protein ACI9JD_004716, partial [Rhodococcus sp. (in: high G+C Gram-positive bacteria)]